MSGVNWALHSPVAVLDFRGQNAFSTTWWSHFTVYLKSGFRRKPNNQHKYSALNPQYEIHLDNVYGKSPHLETHIKSKVEIRLELQIEDGNVPNEQFLLTLGVSIEGM